jgi:OmpA-OmpF porin, OOP family
VQKRALFIVLYLAGHVLCAQSVYWAKSVLAYSSEYFSIEFSAEQCLGKPNIIQSSQLHPSAWVSKNAGHQEYLKVAFEVPLRIQQIAVVEPINPGALYQCFAYDISGNEYLLFELKGNEINRDGGFLNIFFKKTEFLTSSIKLVFDGSKIDGRVSVDAIAISDSDVPITFEINLKGNLRNDIVVERLLETINSSSNEVRPIVSPDGNSLYFSRQNHPDNVGGESDKGDIWVSEYDENDKSWSVAKNAGTTLNNKDNNFVGGLVAQGEALISVLGTDYNAKHGRNTEVSLSHNMTGDWSDPVSLDFVNDISFMKNFDIHLSVDKKIMLIANHGLATLGSKDMYVSFLQKSGKWSDPLHLGMQINSVGEESAPYLMPDNTTLYFSSDGFAGYGGKDIYVTQRLDNTWTNWTIPENMGSTINTQQDETYFTYPSKGGYAYLSRSDSNSNMDIYRINLPLYTTPVQQVIFKGSFYDRKTKEPIEANIYLENNELESYGNDFEFILESGQEYEFKIESDQYEKSVELVSLLENIASNSIYRNIFLNRMEAEVLQFDRITFASNKATLEIDSYPDLEKIIRMMQERKDIKLEISSHTDNLGLEEDNMRLSEARAKTILHYLTEHGVDKDRLTIKWYGESRPIVSNDTEEGRLKNRRVEFKVIND